MNHFTIIFSLPETKGWKKKVKKKKGGANRNCVSIGCLIMPEQKHLWNKLVSEKKTWYTIFEYMSLGYGTET